MCKKKTTNVISSENLTAVSSMTIEIMGEIRTCHICECEAYDMITDPGMHLHTCMEAIIADVDDIIIPSAKVKGEATNFARVMRGDIVFAASSKFMKDFWLKFDKKKQVMMIHIIIARTAALMSGVTCMTDLYDKVMIYMNAITTDTKFSRGKIIAALKKINSYEEGFCKKYLKELRKANIGLTADDDTDFGDYDDDTDEDECCCEECCG